MAPITFGVLTVSDTCYTNEKSDLSGQKLQKQIADDFPQSPIRYTVVPDELEKIRDTLLSWSSTFQCDVIFTTGGTGFSPRDVTPEATRTVIEREAPALSVAMTTRSLQVTDMAMLSRSVCGIKDSTLIVNLPGSAKAGLECFGFIKKCLPHAVALLRNETENVRKTHEKLQGAIFDNGPSKVKVNQAAMRNRHSPYEMVSVGKAQTIIEQHCSSDQSYELVDLKDALGRIIAEDVYSSDPLPPFRASLKDGYAVRASDGCGIRVVRGVLGAGDDPNYDTLEPGVVRINTGAPVPQWADAVVQVEDTTLAKVSADGTREELIQINVAPTLGQDIRDIGTDLKANEKVVNVGEHLSNGHIGVLASIGKTKIKVYKRASVGIVSTGNELQDPHEEPKPGHVRDSNKLTLQCLLKQYGFVGEDCGVAKDHPDSVKCVFAEALRKHDVLITTGGVSMGEFDVVKDVLIQDFSATIHFGRVNMKPGKPATFATIPWDGKVKYVFALPGNPVSALVTSVLFVIPALRLLENNDKPLFPSIPVRLGRDYTLDSRPEYARVSLTVTEGNIVALPVGDQISSRLNSFVGASGLLELPGKAEHPEGLCPGGTILSALLLEPLNIFTNA